jgi:MFS family permease
MINAPNFKNKDIALTGIFSAIYVIMNLTLGPVSFMLTGLPIIHDVGVFSTLLLVAWITRRFGTSSMTGIIGSILAMLISGMALMVGFLPAAIVFDVVLIADHHKIGTSAYSMIVAAIATILSAYVAGVVIGLFFMGMGVQLALMFWGVWHAIGGVIAVVITFPIIALLEKENVREIRSD